MNGNDPKQIARMLFDRGVAAADPARAVAEALTGVTAPAGRRQIIAIGKAARRMAEAALGVLGPCETLVVTNYENAQPLAGATVMAAGHPVPDANGAAAADAVIARLSGLSQGDEVLALISGGGSALVPAPVAGVSLEDKAEVNRLLLASGADITEMNLVRQALSRLKGGGMLRLAAPARVRALILSDVVGDDLRVIASGPTVAPLGTAADARALLDRRGLWGRVPDSVRAALAQDRDDPPLPRTKNVLIGSNALSVQAMAAAARGAIVAAAPLTGDVEQAAQAILNALQGPGTYLFGGETTVQLRGQGRGGRNQELALRVALAAEARGLTGFVFLSGGTDGRDGPTDAAGGLVDDGTLARIRAAGIDPADALARNDSYPALAAAGDLLMTGATGTNVADLQVFILLPPVSPRS